MSEEPVTPAGESVVANPAATATGNTRRRFIRTSIAATGAIAAAGYTKPSFRSFGVPAALAVSGPVNGGIGGGDGGGGDDDGPPLLTCVDCAGQILFDNACHPCMPGFTLVGGICVPQSPTPVNPNSPECLVTHQLVGGICIPRNDVFVCPS